MNAGEIRPEPLIIRANAGDCVEVRFTNLLPDFLVGSAFQLPTITDITGYHIHLVKFDTITSDGSANGWNNIAGTRRFETLIERFFADEELHTALFHDHLFANSHQQHGMFGAMIIEPAGAAQVPGRSGSHLFFHRLLGPGHPYWGDLCRGSRRHPAIGRRPRGTACLSDPGYLLEQGD